MELELCLSITNNSTFHKIPSLKELDLINYVNCATKHNYYYKNDDYYNNSSSSNSCCESSSGNYDQENKNYGKKKRRFNEVDNNEFCMSESTLLPLLIWDEQPNEDDNKGHKRLCNSSSFNISKDESDEIVGWPPIKTYRKKLNDAQLQQCCGGGGRHRRGNILVAGNDGLRSLYVKVQMQGCLITRKIDLKQYHCYESLTSSLLHMFGKGEERMDDYNLTYQDRDGDWLLAGDVPWRTFIRSVQRLKLLRMDD